jgi:branched-chain amino acid transport system substrate-binding protein
MRGNLFKVVTPIVILTFGLLGCSSSKVTGSAENTGKQAQSSDMIAIGYIGALSGNSATMGIPGKNGAELAVKEINKKGGINGKEIRLVALDDKGDPATSATQAQKLINDEKVVGILGGPNSGTVKANSQVISQYGVPELIAIAQEDTLIDPKSNTFKTTFSMSENNSYDVKAIAKFLKTKKYNRIGVIADDSAYGQGGTKTIKRIMAEEGIEVAQTVGHPLSSKDLTAQVLKLRQAKVDAVYVYSLGPDGALFMKTVKQVGWEIPVVGGRGLNMKAFLDLAGDSANGMILPSVNNAEKKNAQAFNKKYDEKYGDDPAHVYSSLGYDAMNILVEALKSSKGDGRDELVKALEGLKDVDTISGGVNHKASFSKEKHYASNNNFIVFNEVKDGKFVMLTDDVESGW